jgi:hypothetical protein
VNGKSSPRRLGVKRVRRQHPFPRLA